MQEEASRKLSIRIILFPLVLKLRDYAGMNNQIFLFFFCFVSWYFIPTQLSKKYLSYAKLFHLNDPMNSQHIFTYISAKCSSFVIVPFIFDIHESRV